MSDISKNIKNARLAAKLTQPELADRCGWGQSRLSNYERGQREPGLDDIKTIAKALNTDYMRLLTGTDSVGHVSDHSATYKPSALNNAILEGGLEPWDSKTPLHEDEVALPFYMEVALAAGAGSSVQLEIDGPKLRFAKSTLKRAGVDPNYAAVVRVVGNSMDPVLPDGSTVGIDTLSTAVKDGKTYAINHDGMLRLKMLYRLPGGGLRIKSFNSEEYPDEIYSAEQATSIVVIGRVFWSSMMW